MSNLTLQDLKAECHLLIEEILKFGVSRNKLYFILRMRTHCEPGKEHIGSLVTMDEGRQYLRVLHGIRSHAIKQRQREEKQGKRNTPDALDGAILRTLNSPELSRAHAAD